MYKICFTTLLITNMFPLPFAIFTGVALEEYKKYKNLPHGISGTTQYYNKCLKHWVYQPTHFSYYSLNATLMVMTKVIDICWWLITSDATYFIHMHLLILLHKIKYSLIYRYATYEVKYYVNPSWYSPRHLSRLFTGTFCCQLNVVNVCQCEQRFH